MSRERQGGYEDALREHDLPINQQYIWQGNYTIQSGVEGATRLLTKHPEIEALFVINYYMSLGALKALRQNFSKRHVEMLVFDHFFVNDIFYPSISSIEQPVATIGKTAGRLLIERLVKGKEGNYETIYCKNSLRT
ncbi:substrate-binding domain-containing protein [Pediococcus acidilactici]